MSVADAARSGDRRLTLEALRDRLAADVDAAHPNVVAQIAGKLTEVLRELDELPVTGKGSKSDDLAARRKARRAKAAVSG